MKLKVLLAVVAAGLTVPSSFAGICGGHCVDGLFNGDPGSTTDSPEWSGTNVAKTFFAPSGISGNAWLYAEQGGQGNNTLFLMYDYLGGINQASFFDVFFEVGLDDYAVHILPGFGNFQVYEKPVGLPSGVVNGALDLDNAPWTLLGSGDPDLTLAHFQAAIGFGLSPNSTTPHAMAEFALSVNRSADPNNPDGLYSPEPAFWSASEKGPGIDPPISSGIFTLNPDGSTTIVPVLGPGGGPVLEGTTVPEPGTLWILASGGLVLMALRRRR